MVVKKNRLFAAVFIIGFVVLSSAALFMLFTADGEGKNITIYVKKGTGGITLFNNLKKSGINNSRVSFLAALKINGIFYGAVKPGFYDIKSPVSSFKLGKIFCSGRVAVITFPEGITQKKIAVLIEKKMKLKNSSYLENLKKGIPDYEGRLFPATYRLDSNNPEELIQKMLRTYKQRTEKLNPDRSDLILASIIQVEGANPDEFKRISGVFHNRLKNNMKLESDPTLQYIVGRIRLTVDVLKNRSPYNSYMYYGLPPGPVCNPGIDAIEAAMFPEKHDFYYFVSKGNGWHYFSKTKREHFRAVGFYQLGYNNGFKPAKGHYIR